MSISYFFSPPFYQAWAGEIAQLSGPCLPLSAAERGVRFTRQPPLQLRLGAGEAPSLSMLPRKGCGIALILLLLLTFFFPAFAQTLAPIPPLTGPVVDITSTLQPQEQAALSQRIVDFSKTKGAQLQLLIIPTTGNEEIAQYAVRVGDAWKIGRKNIDDGVLLIVAKDDHKIWLAPGRGLEGVIPDIYAKRITADIMRPQFKAGNFAQGINDGVDAIIKLVNGETLPAPPQQPSYGNRQGGGFGQALIMGLFAGTIVGGILRAVGGKALGFLGGAGVGGFIAFLVGGGIIGAVIAGIAGALFSLMRGGGGGGYYGGGFGGWSSGGGGGFGGGGGGGGWSGGGGGFSGGGGGSSW